jgi:hypothetical protein
MLRTAFHFQHPTSPLSSDRLVHGAFFCKSFPRSAVSVFAQWMPSYESMKWPMAMMGSFTAWWKGLPSWLNLKDILSNVTSVQSHLRGDHVCIMVGSEDVLMDLDMARKQTSEYRAALRMSASPGKQDSNSEERADGSTTTDSGDGVRFVIVHGAGHHLQNDLQRDAGAEALLAFARQV